jgi:hypothetical protein
MVRSLIIVGCVVSHLLLLIWMRTCFALNPASWYESEIYANIGLLSIAAIAALAKRGLVIGRQGWALLAVMVLYGLSVMVPTAGKFGLWSLCTVEAFLTPLTIFSLGWAVPRALPGKSYKLIFMMVLAFFTVHTALTAYLVATNTHLLFGQELCCENGRPFLYLGKRGGLFTGIFLNPNALASYLMLLPAVAFTMCAQMQQKWRKPLMASGALLALHLLLLMSRSASLTMLAAPLAACLLSKGAIRGRKLLASVGFLSAFAYACCLLIWWQQDNTLALRSMIWGAFVESVIEYPYGLGWNGLSVIEQNPHNLLMANLVYFGVAGCISLLAILSLMTLKAVQVCRQERTLVMLGLSLAAVLIIHQSLEYVVTYPTLFSNSLFWLLLGYLQIRAAASTKEPLESADPAEPALLKVTSI